MKNLIFVLLIFFSAYAGAQVLSLDSCLNLAERNFPLLEKAELLRQTKELNDKISQISYYPSIKLNAQTSWQSDVTQVSIDNPMFAGLLPEISKDQYKVYAEFNQTIFDGGINKAKKEIEEASLNSGLSQIDSDIFNFKEKIANLFFAALTLQKQSEILDMKSWQLDLVIGDLRIAQENDVVMQSQIDILLAEKILVQQNITELQFEYASLIKMLSVYCGVEFYENVALLVPTPELVDDKTINRPELRYFELQQQQILAGKSILETSRMPKVFAFAQAGYGRPGLNMLSNSFEPYAIVGAKLVWTPWEWNKSKNEIQLLTVKSEIVANSQKIFVLTQNAILESQYQKILKIRRLSETDQQLIELRESITKSYLAQLNGGVIKSTDYLLVLNDESTQRFKIELHELMLYEAIVKYNMIKGEIYGE